MYLAEKASDDLLIKQIAHGMQAKIKGNLQESIKIISEIITDASSDIVNKSDLHVLLAHYYRENGEVNKPLSVLEEALRINPKDIWLTNELAFEYAEQHTKLEHALDLINYSLRYQPENPIFIDTKGWILFKTGEIEQAKSLIEKSLDLNSNSKETQKHYQRILETIKDEQRL